MIEMHHRLFWILSTLKVFGDAYLTCTPFDHSKEPVLTPLNTKNSIFHIAVSNCRRHSSTTSRYSIASVAAVEAWIPRRFFSLILAGAARGLYRVPNLAINFKNVPLTFTLMIACFLPTTLLGTYRHEYGVSYGYGAATALSAFCILRYMSTTYTSAWARLAKLHCAAIIFQGMRLVAFFLYRELALPRFRRMRQGIEKRQIAQDGMRNKFISRLPFLFSCSCLYAALVMPAYISMMVATGNPIVRRRGIMILYKTSLALTSMCFAVGALADIHKSLSKARFGSNHLVTGGIYRFIRHPNYSAEMVAWISSAISPIWAIVASDQVLSFSLWTRILIPLIMGLVGTLGISFILSAATCSLEIRQEQKYGGMDKYHEWTHHSWAGIRFNSKLKL